MKCIQFLHSSFPNSFHSQYPKQNLQMVKNHKLPIPSTQQLTTGTSLVKPGRRVSVKTNSTIAHLVILAETSPAQGGDLFVLLQIGALLLFVYGIANFVVPAFLMKSFQVNEENEDG